MEIKKIILLLCFFSQLGKIFLINDLSASENVQYFQEEDVSRSNIQWEDMDVDKWLSFDEWLRTQDFKNNAGQADGFLEEISRPEMVGRVLECIGQCRIYRGEGYVTGEFRSSILEGDDIQTMPGSYAWIFLIDGTLVRLSPNTTVSFNEINIGTHDVFHNVRLASGNLIWYSRLKETLMSKNVRETDSLFLPLKFYKANASRAYLPVNEDKLFSFFESDISVKKQYERLNELIHENNRIVNKRSSVFLVMPNGSLFGNNLIFEVVSLFGANSYFQIIDEKKIGYNENRSNDMSVFFRGFENTKSTSITDNKWHEIDPKGRELRDFEAPHIFDVNKILIKRIPSILVARELMFKRYSLFAFSKLNALKFAQTFKYRLWGRLEKNANDNDVDEDLALRFEFLQNYTRRVETSALLSSRNYREILEKRGGKIEDGQFDLNFFNRALVNYLGKGESVGREELLLNSTRRPFWNYVNGRSQ